MDSTNGRPSVIYVSYDGMSEPLGRSQVVAYLTRLAREFDIRVISFEKAGDDLAGAASELGGAGIRWLPLRYHRRPPVLSTLLDVLAGLRRIRLAMRDQPVAIIHVRSYVPALMALLARRRSKARLVFDIRGFWVDERVEGGLWRTDGMLYRLAKRCEKWFFAEADAVVTLTDASIPQIRAWLGPRRVPVVVIPTCVELERFSGRPQRLGGPHAVWSGSVGTWYRFDLVAPLARALGTPLTVITRQRREALRSLAGLPATIVSRSPEDVPGELFAGDIGLCLIKSSFSKIASAPTRLGEYLAAGMPVVVTPGVGDLETLVEENGLGVVLRSEDSSDLAAAARAALKMASNPAVSERCRAIARERFDVETGVARYAALYRQLLQLSRAEH